MYYRDLCAPERPAREGYVARYYDPVVGRFISADTLIPQPGSSQAYDRFAYVNNNPINFNDPSGYAMQIDGGGSCVGIYCLVNKPDPDLPLIKPVPTPIISVTPTPSPAPTSTSIPMFADGGQSDEEAMNYETLLPIIQRMSDPFMGVYAMNPMEEYLPIYMGQRTMFKDLASLYPENGINLQNVGNMNNPLSLNVDGLEPYWGYLVNRSGYYPYSAFLENLYLDKHNVLNYEPHYLNTLMSNPDNLNARYSTSRDIYRWITSGTATFDYFSSGPSFPD